MTLSTGKQRRHMINLNITHLQINCTRSMFILAAVYVYMVFLVILCAFGVLVLRFKVVL